MRTFVIASAVIAVLLVLLFPLLRAAAASPPVNRQYLAIWTITFGLVLFGAAFPINTPKRPQSWLCAIMVWLAAVVFLATAFIQMAYRYPHS